MIENENEEAARGKAAKLPKKQKRRNYASEFRELSGNVEQALRMLQRAKAEVTGTASLLVDLAIEALEGVK